METEEEIKQTYESVAEDNNLAEDAFIAFCKAEAISADECDGYVVNFEDAFIGDYDSNAHFAEQYYEMNRSEQIGLVPLELYNAIDWDAVWESSLRHDFYEEDHFYFRNL